jgi:Uma2 family endonuclease
MSSQPVSFLTPDEYLELERRAEQKSEYFQGETFAMAGASPRHVRIVTNIVIELGRQLKGASCQVFSTDLRIRVMSTGLFTYPDVTVVCGELRYADTHKDTVVNPVVLIEVLSDSTRDYDRGRKFQHYRAIESLAEYLTIEQDEPHLEHYVRQPENRWLLTEIAAREQGVTLASIGCTLALNDIYDKVEF